MKRKGAVAIIILLAVLVVVYFLWNQPVKMTWEHGMCRDAVQTAEGPVTGTGEDGPAVCAYKGVPYAAPPVGDLRWKPPEAAKKRSGVFEAVSFGNECCQKPFAPGFASGDYKPVRNEDCLFANIWRPKKEGAFPVMVWIHGGGLRYGSSSEPMYRGDRLAAQMDVVMVSFNYRLGTLGFLAHRELAEEDPNSTTGNYGLLDQIAALEWVKNNIAGFGGDPNNVTIFGESAGGRSVCNLMTSPLAAGLFHKAIIQSGSCDKTNTIEEGFAKGDEFAEQLGCSGAGTLECMRSKTSDELVALTGGNGSKKVLVGFGSYKRPWTPHEDNWFITETPIKSIKSGNYNRVPLIVGSTRDEMKLFVALGKATYRMTRNSKVKAAMEGYLGDDLIGEFEKLYPYDKYRKAIDVYVDAIGDISMGCKNFDAAEASSLHEPTYYYRFDYDDHRLPNHFGAAHTMEIPIILNGLDRPYFNLMFSGRLRKKALPLINAMMNYWANFAKKGDPNGEGLMAWPKYDKTNRQRMYLDVPQRVGQTGNVEKCEFWKTNEEKFKDNE